MSTASKPLVAAIACRLTMPSRPTAAAYSAPLTLAPRSRRWRVSGRSSSSRAGSTGTVWDDTAHTVSKAGITIGGIGSSMSTTSWPSSASNRLAFCHAVRHSGSTSAPGTGGCR